MNLTEQLQADMKTAMRDGDAERRDTLRMVISAAQVAAKDNMVAARACVQQVQAECKLTKKAAEFLQSQLAEGEGPQTLQRQ